MSAVPPEITEPAPAGSERRPIISTGAAMVASALIVVMALGYCSTRMLPGGIFARNETKVSHDMVVSQIRAVARLVSSEATVRDVVAYENTWYGSTKQSLIVVTGKVTAGIDLRDNPEIRIDHDTKKIRIRIPPAKLMGVEVLDMTTYDERGGLWNPFRPSDRDAIQRLVRVKLTAAGQQPELLRHANESAAEMLRLLLGRDGYTVEVTTRGSEAVPFVD